MHRRVSIPSRFLHALRIGLGAVALILCGFGAFAAEPTNSARAELLAQLNLPASFRVHLLHRAQIDDTQGALYGMLTDELPERYLPQAERIAERSRVIRLIATNPPPAIREFRASLPQRLIPPRGYIAPILEQATNTAPIWTSDLLSESERRVRGIVEARLATDGLLRTLPFALAALDVAAPRGALAGSLAKASFPIDLLQFFDHPSVRGDSDGDWIAVVASALKSGEAAGSIVERLRAAQFRFVPRHAQFRVLAEDGRERIETVRVQFGGGYAGGIVRGDNLDVLNQLAHLLPDRNFVISSPADAIDPLRYIIGRSWPLRRAGQATLLAEPTDITSWAQDNSKPGRIEIAGTAAERTMLVPRYASVNDGVSEFVPSDSFLIERLVSAGIRALHSPLHFQGGNLVCVTAPRTGERLLLIGEAELHRNRALGLTDAQTLEAFRVEFGVDRCEVFPAGSFHLDYDVTFRAVGGKMLAFVNDPMAAATNIVTAGIGALRKAGVIPIDHSTVAPADFRALRLGLLTSNSGKLSPKHAESFRVNGYDSPTGNLQLFCAALDWLIAMESSVDELPADQRSYFEALRAMNAAADRQRAFLERQGFSVVAIPSLPDLRWSLNYLNGVQDKDAYWMPAQGGFYGSLDALAKAAFERALGPGARVMPIHCGEAQRKHGALHCMISVLETAPAR